MKRSLRILCFILGVVLITGIFTACTREENQQASGTTQAVDTSVKNTAEKYPLILKDAKGNMVTLQSRPEKIVSMPLGTCEMLMSMVDKSRIAAMTYYADDAKVSNIAGEAKGVGKRTESNAEKIIALQPDLVLMDNMTDANVVKQLKDANITVFLLNTPSNIDQVKDNLKLVGDVVGEEAKAQDLINWMDEKLKAVSDKIELMTDDQKQTVLDYSEMGTTSGKGTNFDDIVTRAGLINPASKDGLEGWPELSKEMIIKYNPQIIILPSWYYDTKVNFYSLNDKIKGDKALAGVKAVKNNKIISVPHNHISSTSQYAVLAVEDIAKVAYPELFK
ncbi:ABC transporter substrate-binding protein [Ruminiclostridium cellulolyticum]|uniref:Periplasmic binding protein n=1 Tax=Ruminiclostridium cellulolyticum (strain ATCC 35319 / DSM 5812 / JCM 6584 / H10) TaxID=394503 RepID=B8I0G8_RUMCH|nr:ABC transporter substrate-binding protein [Ruminiclostridium cellulolyticum]ACL77494.1 periplasmic binding protein [Ruminiclostridium cellulolyticum H10]